MKSKTTHLVSRIVSGEDISESVERYLDEAHGVPSLPPPPPMPIHPFAHQQMGYGSRPQLVQKKPSALKHALYGAGATLVAGAGLAAAYKIHQGMKGNAADSGTAAPTPAAETPWHHNPANPKPQLPVTDRISQAIHKSAFGATERRAQSTQAAGSYHQNAVDHILKGKSRDKLSTWDSMKLSYHENRLKDAKDKFDSLETKKKDLKAKMESIDEMYDYDYGYGDWHPAQLQPRKKSLLKKALITGAVGVGAVGALAGLAYAGSPAVRSRVNKLGNNIKSKATEKGNEILQRIDNRLDGVTPPAPATAAPTRTSSGNTRMRIHKNKTASTAAGSPLHPSGPTSALPSPPDPAVPTTPPDPANVPPDPNSGTASRKGSRVGRKRSHIGPSGPISPEKVNQMATPAANAHKMVVSKVPIDPAVTEDSTFASTMAALEIEFAKAKNSVKNSKLTPDERTARQAYVDRLEKAMSYLKSAKVKGSKKKHVERFLFGDKKSGAKGLVELGGLLKNLDPDNWKPGASTKLPMNRAEAAQHILSAIKGDHNLSPFIAKRIGKPAPIRQAFAPPDPTGLKAEAKRLVELHRSIFDPAATAPHPDPAVRYRPGDFKRYRDSKNKGWLDGKWQSGVNNPSGTLVGGIPDIEPERLEHRIMHWYLIAAAERAQRSKDGSVPGNVPLGIMKKIVRNEVELAQEMFANGMSKLDIQNRLKQLRSNVFPTGELPPGLVKEGLHGDWWKQMMDKAEREGKVGRLSPERKRDLELRRAQARKIAMAGAQSGPPNPSP